MLRRSIRLFVICGSVTLVSATGDEVSLTTSRDNTLYESGNGARSNGSGAHFFVGNNDDGGTRRGLVMFDVGSVIPAGATINSVSLRLRMTQTKAGNQQINLHRALSSWGEGASNAGLSQDGGGAPSEPGDATWRHRFYTTDFWQNAGGDHANTVSASTFVGGFNFFTWPSTPEFVADVQQWIDDPSSNHGWLIRGNEFSDQTAKRFACREHPNASFHPLLTIDFTPPAPTPGDGDGDGDVDLQDIDRFFICFTGPSPDGGLSAGCQSYDLNSDGDVDFADYGEMQLAFTGP